MTQDEMFDHIRAQMRQGVTAIEAVSKTLSVNGSEILKFSKGEKNMYVRCDIMPARSITIVDFLCRSNGLTWRIVAFSRLVELDGAKEYIPTPYIHISQ